MIWVSLFAFVGVWAAVAPQAALSLGERLRFGFEAITIFCVGVAATSGLRRRVSLMDGADLPLKRIDGVGAKFGFDCARAGQEVLPVIPFFVFLAAVEVITPFEVSAALGTIALTAVIASAVVSDRLALSLAIAAGLLFFTRRRNSLEIALCGLLALHMIAKGYLAWSAVEFGRRNKLNLRDEAMAPVEPVEIMERYRAWIWKKHTAVIVGLVGINLSFVLLVVARAFSITWEQKLAIAAALTGGVGLLIIDASAVVWCGLLRGVAAENTRGAFATLFGTIVGMPWAVAWIFSALHSGEALTFNEAAAYFVLWSLLGGTISWISRANAKARLTSDLRALLAEA